MQHELATLVAQHREIPAPALGTAKTFLLDTLAIGVAGRRAAYRDELVRVTQLWGAGDACNVLGEGGRFAAPTAAYLNAFQMHCLEFDCVHEGAVAHVMTAPVAAALAEAQQTDVTGTEFLRALVVGVEVASVLGLAATAPLTFFRPATTGVFGAAATVAALRGYDTDLVLETFGYALAQCAGTMQAHEEGKPTLPIQLAGAARAGLIAADLAQSGIPAPHQSIDGAFGYLSLFEASVDAADLTAKLADPWRVTELSHKPFPSGRATHGGVEGLLKLRAKGVNAADVEKIVLQAPALIHQLVIRPALPDMNVNYARLCFPYVGAVALLNGGVSLGDFEVSALREPRVLALAERFAAEMIETDSPAAFTPQKVTARLRDGRSMSVDVPQLLGSPAHPLDQDDQHRKVRDCLRAVYADEGRADALIRAVAALDAGAGPLNLFEPITGD